jgi:dTMP kinase
LKGKLIIIEGVDSSGKATHTKMLYERLVSENIKVKKVEFPNYSSDSSALVKMYLNGDFGDKPEDVNPYASSMFFAIDRFASFKTIWKDFYDDGGIVISDRYTMSNMIHQAAKEKDAEKKKAFLEWLWDLEFNKLGIPVPDCVIFLDMPPKYAMSLMKDRKNKITGQDEKDIHENDFEYLLESYENACGIAKVYNWNHVYCVKDEKIRNIADIHKDIYSIVMQAIK